MFARTAAVVFLCAVLLTLGIYLPAFLAGALLYVAGTAAVALALSSAAEWAARRAETIAEHVGYGRERLTYERERAAKLDMLESRARRART